MQRKRRDIGCESKYLQPMFVYTHMSIQISGLGKLQLANLAFVRFLPCVRPQVFDQRRAVGKSAGTHFAAVWPLTCMRAHVRGH